MSLVEIVNYCECLRLGRNNSVEYVIALLSKRIELVKIADVIEEVVGKFQSASCKNVFDRKKLLFEDKHINDHIENYFKQQHWHTTKIVYSYFWPEYRQDLSLFENEVREALDEWCNIVENMIKCAKLKDISAVIAATCIV